jgi:tight adherence protein B
MFNPNRNFQQQQNQAQQQFQNAFNQANKLQQSQFQNFINRSHRRTKANADRQMEDARRHGVAAGIAAGIFGFSILPSLLLAAAFGIGVPHFIIGRMGRKRTAAFLQLFPEAIDLMVRALRSGLPISEAIVNAGHEIADPVGIEFLQIESGMRLGRELDNILWEIARRITAPEFRFFIIALNVQRETGGNLAETLGNLADVLRRRRTMRAKARAMASEARASTMILGSLPIVVTGILFLTSPSYVSLLFTDVRGLVLVGIAVGMLVTGIGIMVKMARFEI